jgi:hypothetical protein
MPIADSEAPEQSLGDCSICMDAIMVESPNNRGEKIQVGDGSMGGGGFFNAMQRGVAGTKKSYSLAPCHHLFVRFFPGQVVFFLNFPLAHHMFGARKFLSHSFFVFLIHVSWASG